MKLYVLPPSPRAFKVLALKNHLGIECEIQLVDLSKGDQFTSNYLAMNPNSKMPLLEGDAWVPAAERLQLPVAKFAEIARWYGGLASLPAWRASMVS